MARGGGGSVFSEVPLWPRGKNMMTSVGSMSREDAGVQVQL